MYIYGDSTIKLVQGDITRIKIDAIVNAANNTLLGGGGVDGAIHKAGGKTILEQCKAIGGCPTGEARITTAGNLSSKYVIHTVGPVYSKGSDIEAKLLYNAYYNSMDLAIKYELKGIAFPSISTGAYNYPKEDAVVIAINAIMDFIDKAKAKMDIIFVLFSEVDFNIYKNYLDKMLL